jgi:hypothetical protein
MKTQKMSLATVQGKLSRKEMKNIMAGSYSGTDESQRTCGSCSSAYDCKSTCNSCRAGACEAVG